MKIFVHAGGQQLGPFSVEELNTQVIQGRIAIDSALAWFEGCAQWLPLRDVLELTANRPNPAAPIVAPPPPPPQGDATGGIIPYKNPHALIAYYLGIVGLLPAVGILFSIPAVILGIIGLRRRARNPVIKGSVHAWIGIILGTIATLYSLVFIAFFIALPFIE